jgi:hypothetical protein
MIEDIPNLERTNELLRDGQAFVDGDPSRNRVPRSAENLFLL